MEAGGNCACVVGEGDMIEVHEVVRYSLDWCNAWREGDICLWAWEMSIDRCRHPRGTINVVDEEEVGIEGGKEAGQFCLGMW